MILSVDFQLPIIVKRKRIAALKNDALTRDRDEELYRQVGLMVGRCETDSRGQG